MKKNLRNCLGLLIVSTSIASATYAASFSNSTSGASESGHNNFQHNDINPHSPQPYTMVNSSNPDRSSQMIQSSNETAYNKPSFANSGTDDSSSSRDFNRRSDRFSNEDNARTSERNEMLKSRWGNNSSNDDTRSYRRNSSLTVDKATIDKAAQAARKFRNVSDTKSDSATVEATVAPQSDAIVNTPEDANAPSATVEVAPAAPVPSVPSVPSTDTTVSAPTPSTDAAVNAAPAADATVSAPAQVNAATPSADTSVNPPVDVQPSNDPAPLSADTTEKSTDPVSKVVDEAASVADSVDSTDAEVDTEEDKAAAMIESAEKPDPLRSNKDTYLAPGSVLDNTNTENKPQ